MGPVHVIDQAERPFYTIRSLAQRLAVDPKTVRRMIKSGELAAYYVGSQVRIDPDDVDSYLAGRRIDRRAA